MTDQTWTRGFPVCLNASLNGSVRTNHDSYGYRPIRLTVLIVPLHKKINYLWVCFACDALTRKQVDFGGQFWGPLAPVIELIDNDSNLDDYITTQTEVVWFMKNYIRNNIF